MGELLNNPMFFYTIAFVIFLGIAFRYGRAPLLGWLDNEILKIRNELEQARKLRAEAEATLADYKIRQAAAMAEAASIVQFAKDEAAQLRAQAEADLKNLLAKHEQQAAERIRLAEAKAINDVRAAAIDAAVAAARQSLTSNMDEAMASRLMDQAIADMPKFSAEKAKAA